MEEEEYGGGGREEYLVFLYKHIRTLMTIYAGEAPLDFC